MKNVLITGGARGIGLGIARRMLDEGYRVISVSRSVSREAAQLAQDREFSVVEYDLSEVAGIHGLVRRIVGDYGPLYGLVNNAAIGMDGVLATQHLSDIERLLRVNLLSVIVLTKSVCRGMISQREGRIVSISSIVSRTGFVGLSVYAASKAGVEGFTFSLAREVGRAGVNVNCIAPGFVETGMTESLGPEHLATIMRRSPLRSLTRPEDVAGAVAYLLGPDGARVTGTVLTVDAGSTA